MGKLASQGTPGVQYTKVDVRKHGGLAQESGVRSIPDTRIFHNGRQVASFVGTKNASSIEKLLSKHRSRLVPNVVKAPSAGSSSAPVVPGSTQYEERAITPEERKPLPPGIQRIPAS